MECSAGLSQSAGKEKCYDAVIVGFGPAALSIAIALHEQQGGPSNVLILESELAFSWRGTELPMGRSKMRSNLIQDLVSARNPKSAFTFINYLWATDNLVGYANLGLLNPPKVLFDMYLQWSAEKFSKLGWIQYRREVVSVEPNVPKTGSIKDFRVQFRDIVNNSTDFVLAKHVIIAPGTSKRLPEICGQFGHNGRIFHMTDYAKALPRLVQLPEKCLNLAVMGSDDAAVEVLDQCLALERQVKVTLFADGSALQQTDKNPL